MSKKAIEQLTGSPAWGWWDVPIPAYMKEKRERYLKQIKEEDLS